MCLIITMLAAVISTVLWYAKAPKDTYKIGTLAVIYWGASLMWFVDFVFEFAELKAEYFNQPFADILNDSVLGLCVAVLGAVAWLIVLLVKDPKGVFKQAK